MSIPDAPWVGKCAEDYYGYGESECGCCAYCGEEFDADELVYHEGEKLCGDCYNKYYGEEEVEEEEDDEELRG